jgi:hypothetical protein
MLSPRLTRFIAIGVAGLAIAAGVNGLVSAAASNGSSTAPAEIPFARSTGPAPGGATNARSGPAAGGASGTVDSRSTSSFTISTSAGAGVTVNETPSTKYQKGTSPTSASAVTNGESVLVLGTTSGTTITADQVVVQPPGGPPSSSAAEVVPFQPGATPTSKQTGQVPANYSEGSGTIVSGTEANQATKAALAAYPGGVVDRVVKLSNGEYEVHNIGVSWPHHVFVDQGFKVVGAD